MFNKKTSDNLLVASIDGSQCRVQHFHLKTDGLQLIGQDIIAYDNYDSLEDALVKWCKQNNLKNTPCRWLLGPELYQSFLADPPNVLEKEMAEALKWQVKEQLEHAADDVLISYYKPNSPNPENTQVMVVSVAKMLVEKLISIASSANLLLDAIEIEELSLGHALKPHLIENKIIGFVGENKSGLVFSFYQNNLLVFTRHKKGLFIPEAAAEFSLEGDAQSNHQQTLEDSFLLETQRTLDYVISQIFRKPVDLILLLDKFSNNSSLAKTINGLVETPVQSIKPEYTTNDTAEGLDMFQPTLAEIGCVVRVVN